MFRTPASLYRVVATAEAITWALLIGAIIARNFDANSLVVTIAGALHGFTFLAYGATAVLTAIHQRWKVWVAAIAVVSAVIPFATIPVSMWLERSGRLTGQWRTDATSDPRDHTWYDRTMRWFVRRPWVLGTVIALAVVGLYTVLLLNPPR